MRIKIFTIAWIAFLYLFVLFLPQSTFSMYTYEEDTITINPPQQLWHLANFDGAHYQNIATWGYIASFQTAFFPLFPLLIYLITKLIPNQLIVGLLITCVSTLIATILFKYLTKKTQPIIAMLVFPLSFFFITSYTESLFLMLSLTTWLFFRQKKYLLAGIFGFIAATSRFYGILLFPVLALEFFLNLNSKTRLNLKSYLPFIPLLLIPGGLIAYMIFLSKNFSDPLMFIHSLSLWQKSSITFPLQTLYRYAKMLLTVSPSLFQYKIAVLELSAFLFGLLAAFIFFRQKKYSYSLYILLGSLIPSFTGTLQSTPRYLLVLFPIYILLGTLPKKLFYIFSILSFCLQLYLFKCFLTGQFVS